MADEITMDSQVLEQAVDDLGAVVIEVTETIPRPAEVKTVRYTVSELENMVADLNKQIDDLAKKRDDFQALLDRHASDITKQVKLADGPTA